MIADPATNLPASIALPAEGESLVIARAADMGLSGYESRDELEENRELYARMERIRLAAGERMGMGDVSKSVIPKFAVLAPPRNGGAVTARAVTIMHELDGEIRTSSDGRKSLDDVFAGLSASDQQITLAEFSALVRQITGENPEALEASRLPRCQI